VRGVAKDHWKIESPMWEEEEVGQARSERQSQTSEGTRENPQRGSSVEHGGRMAGRGTHGFPVVPDPRKTGTERGSGRQSRVWMKRGQDCPRWGPDQGQRKWWSWNLHGVGHILPKVRGTDLSVGLGTTCWRIGHCARVQECGEHLTRSSCVP